MTDIRHLKELVEQLEAGLLEDETQPLTPAQRAEFNGVAHPKAHVPTEIMSEKACAETIIPLGSDILQTVLQVSHAERMTHGTLIMILGSEHNIYARGEQVEGIEIVSVGRTTQNERLYQINLMGKPTKDLAHFGRTLLGTTTQPFLAPDLPQVLSDLTGYDLTPCEFPEAMLRNLENSARTLDESIHSPCTCEACQALDKVAGPELTAQRNAWRKEAAEITRSYVRKMGLLLPALLAMPNPDDVQSPEELQKAFSLFLKARAAKNQFTDLMSSLANDLRTLREEHSDMFEALEQVVVKVDLDDLLETKTPSYHSGSNTLH